MTINKAKSSDYNTVNTKGIISYIKKYEYVIHTKLNNFTDEELSRKDRTQLKQIASELETIKKRVEYLNGEY